MKDVKLVILGCSLFLFGHILTWFQNNSQFVWDWWKGRPLFTVLLFAVPTSLTFWYGVRFTYYGMGEKLWSARFLAYAMSYMSFPLLTYMFLGESLFKTKTLLCIALSFCILAIQIFWK
tara:strand:+ start:749 stop:1105 length:357 start_codon:yes stop_codon:yes gene_type:complete